VVGRGAAPLQAFHRLLDDMRRDTRNLCLSDIVRLVLERSGLQAHYRSERDGADRVENLEELINAAEAFVTQEGFGRDAVALPVDALAPDGETGEIVSPLAAFLTHASLEAGEHQAQAGQDAVQLMTVHAAKGLEFDAVFLTGLEEGLFPHENAQSTAEGLEEERRLMYVAITRARQRLYLSFSQTRLLHGQTRYNMASRFIEELPPESLKWLAVRPSVASWAAPAAPARAFSFAASTGLAQPPVSAGTRGGFRIGQGVFHNKFGEGVVMTLEGSGDEARIQVRFGRHGVKWLALGVAKLTPLP
jgi:DNA helicase II / ATP-dependent DNA helicase PcrA